MSIDEQTSRIHYTCTVEMGAKPTDPVVQTMLAWSVTVYMFQTKLGILVAFVYKGQQVSHTSFTLEERGSFMISIIDIFL